MGKNIGPKGIIFDFGDTIMHADSFDSLAGNRRLLELAEHNPGITAEDAQKVADEIFAWMEPARDKSMLETTCETFDRLIFELLGVRFRVSYNELEKEFWKAATDFKPEPGIYSLLDLIEARRIKTGIISNAIYRASTLIGELERYDMAQRFSFVLTSADYGIRKPHKYIFQVAIKKMKLFPSEIWFVGDTLDYDIKGALDAGMYPVWYNRRNKPGTIDGDYLEIKSLDELKSRIERM
jgi:putative hydrolase of the HAD superfamily